MIIEKYKDSTRFIVENSFIFPNQLTTNKEKEEEDYIKANLDYFTTIALAQYHENRKRIPKNYNIYNGIFEFDDYVDGYYSQDFLSLLDEDKPVDEPTASNLKHYPIINGPIDTMVGELSNRTAKQRVKAIDELSQSEVFEYRQQNLIDFAQKKVLAKLAQKGILDKEVQETSLKELQERVKTYATRAEQWGNKTLKALKNFFNLKAKSEEGYRDYLISGKEFHHIYPNNSNLGFGYKLENPANCWYVANRNARTTDECWAGGTIEVLTISEILDTFRLTEEEISFLYQQLKHPFYEQSQYFTSEKGTDSIQYNAHPLGYFDHLLYSTAAMGDTNFRDAMDDMQAFTPGLNVNQTFVVVRAYWKSKEKIGEFTYIDSEGYEQVSLIDDTIDKEILKQGTVKWTWRNKWYMGYRIGNAIYNMEPLKHTDTMPLIGTFRRLKNTTTRSLLDLMKPYQSLYNILINQIWQLLDKEIGVVFLGDLKIIPKKDSEDPIETMLWEAKEKGALFIDTSVENTGGNLQFNQLTRVDLTRSQEIKDRLELALAIRDTCWEMIGVNRQRMGSTTSSETATAINTALSQSYSQTELWFLEHEYLMDRVTQSLLDTAQYIELQKPESILNYLNSDLDNVFLKVSRNELLRKLFIFTTSSNDDRNIVNTMKELAQPAMQNGAELTDIFDIMYSDSDRKIKDILDDIKIRKEKMIQQENDLRRQEMEQNQMQFQEELARQEEIRKEELYYDNLNKQLDRELKIDIETIKAIGLEGSYNPEVDLTDKVIEQSKIVQENSKLNFERSIKQKELKLKERELDIKEKDSENKLKIARANKNKFDSKKKK